MEDLEITHMILLKIPDKNLILGISDHVAGIVNNIYPFVTDNLRFEKYFEDRTILAPTLRDVESINEYLLSKIPRDMKEYLSSDNVCPTEYKFGGIRGGRKYRIFGIPSLPYRKIPNFRYSDIFGTLCLPYRMFRYGIGMINLESWYFVLWTTQSSFGFEGKSSNNAHQEH
ncbi:hypothetical protein ACS0TY_023799 [Phlomoides rotata]